MFSLSLKVCFSSLISFSQLLGKLRSKSSAQSFTRHFRRSLSETGYSRMTSPFSQISCHVGMRKQAYIFFLLLHVKFDSYKYLRIFYRLATQLVVPSQFSQWLIPQNLEIVWWNNMKNRDYTFSSSSPFLFLVETSSVCLLFQYLQIQYVLHCIIHFIEDWPAPDLEQAATHSHLLYTFQGPGLLIH